MLTKIIIKNYRVFRDFELDFDPEMNILVGNNDAGKSTVLEAIGLALTCRLHGRHLGQELSPHLFNQAAVDEYIQGLCNGERPAPPEIIIDLFFDADSTSTLKGTNNSRKSDEPGVRVRAAFNPEYAQEYREFIARPHEISLVPTEYYAVEWLSFAGSAITGRSLAAKASLIDASNIHLQSGVDFYLSGIIDSNLTPSERVALTREYRKLRETFSESDSIMKINERLAGAPRQVSSRALTLAMDVSRRSSWETSIVPHLDQLPYQHVGKGEQATLKILLALNRRLEEAHVVLVEEPENHLSGSNLGKLIKKIKDACAGKQVFITTHSSYVLNKLGLSKLVLLSPTVGLRLSALPSDTQDFFQKLSGYDTLRLVLATKAIFVEGPSDDLVVQRAYRDLHGCLPSEDGVDVIDARGKTFKRFLDIAGPLNRTEVAVITDNDGQNADDVKAGFAAYTSSCSHITVHVGADATLRTLEPQLLAANGRDVLNRVFDTNFTSDDELLKHMKNNKTTCALAIFETCETITMPEYIRDAVA